MTASAGEEVMRMREPEDFDLVVVGGGINGVGIARDAVGRGLRVLLCEQHDLAGHTSSSSTKLIHGGLRYLEYYEFNLVRKALQEREVLLRAAPHIIWPLRFVMPHNRSLRPAWLIRAGLFLYDHLSRRELLPGSGAIDLRRHVAGAALDPALKTGFIYSDAWVDDARLVVLNAMDARERGATILPRVRCVSAARGAERWQVSLQAADGSLPKTVNARALVNAAGPWAIGLLRDALAVKPRRTLRMAKGSHIVVRRMFDHEHAYILQNPDRRIIFAIPYEREFTLIGTTDVAYTGDPNGVAISAGEVAYLCDMASRYFVHPVTPADVVWSYSGVRPLLEDESADLSAVTRDYVLEYDGDGQHAPLLSVLGGKITTYRKLAEEALDLLAPGLGGVRPAWTAHAPLPGGDIEDADFDGFLATFRRAHAWLPADLALRYARAYGTRAHHVLGNAAAIEQLGEDFGAGLHAAEVSYLIEQEWASSAEDILWRRSKLGLHVGPETSARLDEWLRKRRANADSKEVRRAADA
jgi:glycerol-3-phosphate dehydrogenase